MHNNLIPIHTIFERIVQANPDRVAVSFQGEHLTNRALNEKANLLAHWLIRSGVKVEGCVSVCLRPSFEIIITLIAIQKAGGVYVPIDPDYPKARISSILEDAAPVLTISQDDVIEAYGDLFSCAYTYQQIVSDTENDPCENPQTQTSADDTAYVFYTSGTTGNPKGIAVSYKGLAYYVISAIDQFGINKEDKFLTIAKFSFSISLFDLLTSVVSGGSLTTLPREEIMDYARLSKKVEQATVVHMGPSLLRELVKYYKNNYTDYQPLSGLRHVSSGGDFVPVDLLENLKLIFSRAEFYVFYGSTEIACMGCFYPVPRDIVIERSLIGKPFPGTDTILIEDSGEKVANGEVGEICFDGPGVMKGYLNNPELTQAAFIEVENKRYFRTGDMGRMHSSGDLEFLGRRDFQVKLRGKRIELIDIETHLRKAPGVQEAVVRTAEIEPNTKRLVAYTVLEDPSTFLLDPVRVYLQQQLPGYMHPSGWIILESMPLNENFRISRKALPPATLENMIVKEPYVPPSKHEEQVLITIWQDVLNNPHIGVNDNFVDVGGDSLVAMRLMARVNEAFKLEPQVFHLFNHPTISQILAFLADLNQTHENEIKVDD